MSLIINIIRSNEVRAVVVMVMLSRHKAQTSISQAPSLEDWNDEMSSQRKYYGIQKGQPARVALRWNTKINKLFYEVTLSRQ